MNFSYLEQKQEFKEFASACIIAEESYAQSPEQCAFSARRALELAIRWMYTHDEDLQLPYKDNLNALIHEVTFTDILEPGLFKRIDYIRSLGNIAAHTAKRITKDQARQALSDLFDFIDWIDYSYANTYEEKEFRVDELPEKPDLTNLIKRSELAKLEEQLEAKDRQLKELIEANKNQRIVRSHSDNFSRSIPETEFETRKIYIDTMLMDADWDMDSQVQQEVKLNLPQNPSGIGYADYVLKGKNGKPIAVIEAKKATVAAHQGKEQARLYADALEKEYGIRPLIFYTNGFETYMWDDEMYPPREIAGIFSQDEIEWLLQKRKERKSLKDVSIDETITNRPYQMEAIRRVCETLENKQRTALLVMATGTGKTRVAVNIVNTLLKNNWVKNILFLADRKELVRQAKKAFNDFLPNLTTCNLLENKNEAQTARMVFSTYPTILNQIDKAQTEEGHKLFTPGHFDLIILDETHRSLYNKYRQILEYFDAIRLGLTATPKEDIGKNTYDIYHLEKGNPTFAYEMQDGVKEGYLVPYRVREIKTEISQRGIRYDQLSDEEKEEYENTFEEEDQPTADKINRTVFNKDTIKKVLKSLMDNGIRIENGDKLAKTIIFASNDHHAQNIVEVFDEMYPHLKGTFARKITNTVKFSDHLIDQFKMDGMPQIAVSVDMLDTGIDVPEVCNLVFFKLVRSKAKFWQMIGRGTRTCQNLFGAGNDKKDFLCIDCGGNFDYFVGNQSEEKESGNTKSLNEKIFCTKVDLLAALQKQPQTVKKMREFTKALQNDLFKSVIEINKNSFDAKMKLSTLERFRNEKEWDHIPNSKEIIKNDLSALIVFKDTDQSAKEFDYTMYAIMKVIAEGQYPAFLIKKVIESARQLKQQTKSVKELSKSKKVLETASDIEFWKHAAIADLEEIRPKLRGLMKYLPVDTVNYYTVNFTDSIIKDEEATYETGIVNDLQNYKEYTEHYLKEHLDDPVIHKIRNNEQITFEDIKYLENLMWVELGNKEDYLRYYQEKPLPNLVREISGLNPQVANEIFGMFINDYNLNPAQINFVNMIKKYILENGYIESRAVFAQMPFKAVGNIGNLFKDKQSEMKTILEKVDEFKKHLSVQ